MLPNIRYAKSGNVLVAYQAFGNDEVDLVFVPGFVSNIEVYRDEPHFGRGRIWRQRCARYSVHVAARVAALAEPNECLMTRTVKDLFAGGDVSFLERGKRDLKGIAEAIDLFAVALGR